MPAIQGQSNSSLFRCWACSGDFPVLAQQQAGRATAITVVVVIVYESNPVLYTKKKARQPASSDICIGSVSLYGACLRPNQGRVGFSSSFWIYTCRAQICTVRKAPNRYSVNASHPNRRSSQLLNRTSFQTYSLCCLHKLSCFLKQIILDCLSALRIGEQEQEINTKLNERREEAR